MQENKIQILSTRPIDATLIQQAAEKDIRIDIASFISIEFEAKENILGEVRSLFSKKITAVFTSMNAVEAISKLAPSILNWSIYCIGHSTSILINQHLNGANIVGTAKNAAALATLIIEGNVENLHFFCGDKRRAELPEQLAANNILVQELIVYKTILTPQVVRKDYDGVLFFSPSAVESYFALNIASDHQQYFAIGTTTAAAIETFSKNIITVDETSKEKLVEHMLNYYQRTRTY